MKVKELTLNDANAVRVICVEEDIDVTHKKLPNGNWTGIEEGSVWSPSYLEEFLRDLQTDCLNYNIIIGG